MIRIQTNIVAKTERAVLTSLCQVMPRWVSPDRLTLLGLAGGAIVLAGYALSNRSPQFLWLAIFGYFVHWFGDSMDGSLARYRRVERPRYGYFLDHSVDALANMLIAVGLGLSAWIRMDTALFAFIGYLLLSIYVFLKRQVLDELQLAFLALGPTEIRVILVVLTLLMPWLGAIRFTVRGIALTACDGVMIFGGFAFAAIFIGSVIATAAKLRREEILPPRPGG
jgi:phosphatidylglycerophosphate synthase